MSRLLIGIDIDGVLYPFEQAANEALVDRFGIDNPGPWRYWSYVKDVITPEQWSWLWTQQGTDATCGRMELIYPGASDAFNAVLKSGHECHFVTHRDPRRTALATAMFLERHFGTATWQGLHVTKNGTAKHELAEWDVFVDDKPETVMDMLIRTRAKVFAPVRPWNAELDVYAGRRFTYYTDPREVAEWVLAQ